MNLPKIEIQIAALSWFPGNSNVNRIASSLPSFWQVQVQIGAETCALHAADFMYLIYQNKLVNPWVSMQMKALLARQLDNTKLSTGLPKQAMFYHKTGWYSYWTNDVGIVDDGEPRYVIACFLPLREEFALSKLRAISEKIHYLIEDRHKK